MTTTDILIFIISYLIGIVCTVAILSRNIQKEMKLQDEINSLLSKRVDILSDQLDALYEIVKLESKRLDIQNEDNDDANWWKK
jgi:ABC-type phosphate transport system auxiliary subunit